VALDDAIEEPRGSVDQIVEALFGDHLSHPTREIAQGRRRFRLRFRSISHVALIS
jgi:hypothetical protein